MTTTIIEGARGLNEKQDIEPVFTVVCPDNNRVPRSYIHSSTHVRGCTDGTYVHSFLIPHRISHTSCTSTLNCTWYLLDN